MENVIRSMMYRAARRITSPGQGAGATPAPETGGVDLIEAQFYGLWANESDWFDIGPEGASSLDELIFFRL